MRQKGLGARGGWAFGPFRLDPAAERLRGPGGPLPIGRKAFRLLALLISRPGELVTKEEIIDSVWDGAAVSDAVLTTAIRELRRVLGDDSRTPDYIETAYGRGYRFISPVREVEMRESLASPPGAPASRRTGAVRLLAAAALVLVILAAVAAIFLFRTGGSAADAPREARPSLAVLPFREPSASRSSGHFGEGLAEQIATLLSRDRHIAVIGWNSAMTIGAAGEYRDVRERLGVSHMLEGSVRRQGELLKVAVRLVRTSDGTQMWSAMFDRRPDDVFTIQDEIARSVAAALLGPEESARFAGSTVRTSPRVYDLYLEAQSIARPRSFAGMMRAQDLLRQALSIDPSYAPAHARLAINAMIIDQLRPSGMYQEQAAARPETRRRLERAAALAPGLADAHAGLGMLEEQLGRPAEALRHHQRALALDPGSFLAWNSSGNALDRLCRLDESADAYRKAAAIEPLVRSAATNLAARLSELGRYEQAEAVAKSLLARGSVVDAHRIFAQIALARGDYSEAVRHGERARVLGADDPYTMLLLATAYREMELIAAAVSRLPDAHRAAVGAYWTGRDGEAAQAAGDAAAKGPGIVGVAAARALIRSGRTRQLAELFEREFGSADAFALHVGCVGTGLVAPFVLSLRREGFVPLADAVIERSLRNLDLARRSGASAREIVPDAAILLALDARGSEALELMVRNQDTLSLTHLSDPAFDAIRTDHRFGVVVARAGARAAAERRQYGAQGR